jgi:hypothetical protein
LNWSTSQEVNNDYFLIEKSTDGKNFFFLDRVEGKTVPELRNGYTVFDNEPVYGLNYYRLIQLDLNGNETKYEVIAIPFGAESFLKIRPNPVVNKELRFDYFTGVSQIETLEIVDLSGNTIVTKVFDTVKGMNEVEIDINELSQGVYFMIVNGSIRDKFVVLD